jgi:hypothetical protein
MAAASGSASQGRTSQVRDISHLASGDSKKPARGNESKWAEESEGEIANAGPPGSPWPGAGEFPWQAQRPQAPGGTTAGGDRSYEDFR